MYLNTESTQFIIILYYNVCILLEAQLMVSTHGKQVFLMLNVNKTIHPRHLPNNSERHNQLKTFFETPKVGIIGIFVLLKYMRMS